MDDEELSHVLHRMISAQVLGDPDTTSDCVERVIMECTAQQLFGSCAGVAEAGKQALGKLGLRPPADDNGTWMFVTEGDGRVEELLTPSELFAARFFSAVANGDMSYAGDLFTVEMEAGEERFVDAFCELVCNTAAWWRMVADEAEACG